MSDEIYSIEPEGDSYLVKIARIPLKRQRELRQEARRSARKEMAEAIKTVRRWDRRVAGLNGGRMLRRLLIKDMIEARLDFALMAEVHKGE